MSSTIMETETTTPLSIHLIAHIIIQSLLLMVGLVIQFKIIHVCRKDKDGKTWQIHLAHSVNSIIYFLVLVPFWHLSNFIPNLSEIMGEWFCYLAAFFRNYGFYSIPPNSLLIAVMKYMFIVQNETVIRYGERKTQKLFMVINLMVPFVMAIISCVTMDFESFSDLTSCFGLTEQVKAQYNTWEKQMQKFFLCNLNTTEKEIRDWFAFYVIKQSVCVLKSIIVMAINTNVPEAFFYYQIFRTMNR